MPRIPLIADVHRRPAKFIVAWFGNIRIRNAFADARRAQIARLHAQPVGPLFERYPDQLKPSHEGRSARPAAVEISRSEKSYARFEKKRSL